MTYDEIIKRLYKLSSKKFDLIYDYLRSVYPTDNVSHAEFRQSKDKVLGYLYQKWLFELVINNIMADVQFLYERSMYLPLPHEKAKELRESIRNLIEPYTCTPDKCKPPFLVDNAEREAKENKEKKKKPSRNAPLGLNTMSPPNTSCKDE